MSIAELLAQASAALTTYAIPNPRLDAEVLLAHVLDLTRAGLYARFQDSISETEIGRFHQLLYRRQQREPLQYIIGVQEFWSLEFHVTPDVLIPRPETELVVETSLRLLCQSPIPNPQSPIRILDLGTGSGCIAIALATELPTAEVWALDISSAALVVAQGNAQQLGVAERIHFLQGDLFAPICTQGLTFDLIVSNPPYIAQNDILSLQPEVQNWEPYHALAGGQDGFDFYRRLLQESPTYLHANARLVMEIGHEQGQAVLQLAQQQPELTDTTCICDYEGRERVVLTRKQPGRSPQK